MSTGLLSTFPLALDRRQDKTGSQRAALRPPLPPLRPPKGSVTMASQAGSHTSDDKKCHLPMRYKLASLIAAALRAHGISAAASVLPHVHI